jgi:hypothetical protein
VRGLPGEPVRDSLSVGVTSLDAVRKVSHRGERRARDPLSLLSRRFDAVCISAVDTWEIAAGLEADGMSDTDCTAYGFSDVFGLAEALFAHVPRRGSQRVTPSVRRPITVLSCILRGLIYALPGLVAVAVLNRNDTASIVMLLTALALGWGWSQAWSFLGHRSLGWVGAHAARSVLRSGMVLGVVVLPVALVATALAVGAATPVVVGGVAVAVYMVAAGVLLVLGDDIALLAALVPGSIAGLLYLVGVAPGGLAGTVLLAALSLVIVLVLAFLATRGVVGSGDERTRPWAVPSLTDMRAAAPHFAYGVVCALAVGLGPITMAALRGQPEVAGWYVALPVILSMGAAELQLERLMARSYHLLRSANGPAEFAAGTRRVFGSAVAGYVAAVALSSVLALAIAQGGDKPDNVVLVAGYAALASCFFVALVLTAIGRVLEATTCLTIGLVAYLCVSQLGSSSPAAAYLLSFSLLFLAMGVVALTRLRSPLVHL